MRRRRKVKPRRSNWERVAERLTPVAEQVARLRALDEIRKEMRKDGQAGNE